MEHLIGLHVRINPEIQNNLGLDWAGGIILAAFSTSIGIAVHVMRDDMDDLIAGAVTPAIRLEGLIFTPQGRECLRGSVRRLARLREIRSLHVPAKPPVS